MREEGEVYDNLIQLSVGIEDVEYLKEYVLCVLEVVPGQINRDKQGFPSASKV